MSTIKIAFKIVYKQSSIPEMDMQYRTKPEHATEILNSLTFIAKFDYHNIDKLNKSS